MGFSVCGVRGGGGLADYAAGGARRRRSSFVRLVQASANGAAIVFALLLVYVSRQFRRCGVVVFFPPVRGAENPETGLTPSKILDISAGWHRKKSHEGSSFWPTPAVIAAHEKSPAVVY